VVVIFDLHFLLLTHVFLAGNVPCLNETLRNHLLMEISCIKSRTCQDLLSIYNSSHFCLEFRWACPTRHDGSLFYDEDTPSIRYLNKISCDHGQGRASLRSIDGRGMNMLLQDCGIRERTWLIPSICVLIFTFAQGKACTGNFWVRRLMDQDTTLV
jgi:hypothetical protein